MSKEGSQFLFNTIAPIYGLFFSMQQKRFSTVLQDIKNDLDLTSYRTILDVGCGTGALCSVLHDNGLSVTGIDPAEKMLEISKKKTAPKDIRFTRANILEGLPFEDKCFDISIASFVAHGMPQKERMQLYAEMSRVTKSKVIIYDYNESRSLLTTIIEWLERGDYFHFIRHAKTEMIQCISENNPCFREVKVVNVDVRAAWYICTPTE